MSACCEARQESDEMACSCGLRWHVGDPEPPQCRRVRHVAPVPVERRDLLRGARREFVAPAEKQAIVKIIPDVLDDGAARAMVQAYEKARGLLTPEDCMRRAYRVYLDSLS